MSVRGTISQSYRLQDGGRVVLAARLSGRDWLLSQVSQLPDSRRRTFASPTMRSPHTCGWYALLACRCIAFHAALSHHTHPLCAQNCGGLDHREL
jgi:hypothetical protein